MQNKINHRHQLMLIGSCFTENIGEKLAAHKFRVLQNPNGILFNPVSVAEAVSNYIACNIITEDSLFSLNEAWHSWQHHSRFSSPSAEEAVKKINQSVAEAQHWLAHTDYLLLTLGSAWVYELTSKAAGNKTGKVAANNHKAPADWFNRRLLSISELENTLEGMMQQLLDFNPGIRIIFTISPVRHLREGFVENNRSKAALIHAVHRMVEKYEQAYYFPAYELVMDDLRDYRFFAEDMVHPNYAATNYVWGKFVESCIDGPSQVLMEQINEINAAKAHKPFNPGSGAHKKFMNSFFQKVSILQQQFPMLDFNEEKSYFSGFH